MKRSFGGCIGLAVLAFGLAGCDEPEDTDVVGCYLGEDVTETTGDVSIEYDGFVGRVPSGNFPLALSLEQAERLLLRGCGYEGADVWGLEVDVQVAADVERPVPF